MNSSLIELAWLFLRLGATAFGGPAAHIALMEREFVAARRWLSAQEFLDLLSASNLIPGPNSTELAIHIGQARQGKIGGVVAGVCFILPAALMVLGFAIAYAKFGALPQTRWILTGVQPVVVAIVFHALGKLAATALKNSFCTVLALSIAGLAFVGINEILLIFGAAIIGLIYRNFTTKRPSKAEIIDSTLDKQITVKKSEEENQSPLKNHKSLPGIFVWTTLGVFGAPPLWTLFWTFLKIGSVIYGSGYVLLAFLRADVVENLKWISDRQLLDAVAIGQLTPGPLFTSATFIGYLVHGIPGAIVATVGIFLPAFLFSAISFAALNRIRSSPRARSFLNAVNAASLALMFVVTVELSRAALRDAGWWLGLTLFCATLFALWKTRCNSLWLMLGGALCGYLTNSIR